MQNLSITTNRPTPPEENPADREVVDPLADCLERVAAWHGVDCERSEFLAGLPLENGKLTPALLLRAARRLGLRATLKKRRLKRIPVSVIPAILLLKNGGVGVLEPDSGDGTADFYRPDSDPRDQDSPTTAKSLKNLYSGFAIFLRPEKTDRSDGDEQPGFESAKSRRHWFWKTAWRFRSYYSRLLPASLLINLFAVCMPFFVMLVYDRVVPNDAEETLWVLATGIAIIFLFEFLMRLLRGHVIERAGKEMDQVLASALFEQVMAIDLKERPSSGSALAGRLKAYETLRQFFLSASILALADLPFGLLMIGVIFYVGGPIGWILVCTASIAIFLEILIQFPLKSSVAASSTSSVERQAFISEAIGGLESIKGSRAEGALQSKLEQMMTDASEQEVRSHWLGLLGNSSTTFLLHITTVSVIVASVYRVYSGDMSMGAMIACVLLGARAMAPLAMVAGLMTRLQQALASLRELNFVMNLDRETSGTSQFVHRGTFPYSYRLSDVTVQYPGQSIPALDGIDLKIDPGDRIALLGRVGSGKTTLLRVLAKLYTVTGGEVLLDGIEISQYHPSAIRQQIGFLPQDPVLFSGTLRDNIGMGASGNWTDEAVIVAAKHAGLSEFINSHPEGMHMEIGERGALLSGGQRQSIALARALVSEPDLLLLDEPTAGIDVQTERHILQSLRAYLDEDPKRSLVVSSHKLSVLEIVDRILVLDHAKIVADGDRDAVIQKLKENANTAAGAPIPPSKSKGES
ncbi:MAG: type I secretion system permease/ATPase [Verrucomicrobiales bacterium]|nr:type I secretion system permease/ATPase [Verrucomicrobiales bacterium]